VVSQQISSLKPQPRTWKWNQCLVSKRHWSSRPCPR